MSRKHGRAWHGALVLAMGTALAGCANLGMAPAQSPNANLKLEPLLRTQSGQITAEAAYQLGKAALVEGRHERALAWFENAASQRPQWIEPLNGQAVALARLGKVEQAVAALRAAMLVQPDAAHLHGNMAVLLMRSQQLVRAKAHLDRALALAPEESASWAGVQAQLQQQMAAAQPQPDAGAAVLQVAKPAPAQAPQTADAATVRPQASQPKADLAQHSAGANPVASIQPAGLAAVAAALPEPVATAMPLPRSARLPEAPAATANLYRWLQHSPHVMELVELPPIAVAQAHAQALARLPVATAETKVSAPVLAAATVVAAPSPQWALAQADHAVQAPESSMTGAALLQSPASAAKPVADLGKAAAARSVPLAASRVEFSNGAGATGLARQTAGQLAASGAVGAVRLTNHAHYRVSQTEIHYRSAEDRAAASALARALGMSVALVHEPLLAQGVSLRVLLGHDAAQRAWVAHKASTSGTQQAQQRKPARVPTAPTTTALAKPKA